MERLQKYLSMCGVASRRKSEELIKKGKVQVNGKIVTELGTKVSNKDIISVNGKIVMVEQKKYYLLYKPEKIVTTTKDEKDRTSVIDLVKSDVKLFPVGRLDYDTSGLILLTNDGELSNLLIHPSKDIEKEYSVKLNGIIKIGEVKELEKGINIDGVKTKKCKIKLKKVDKKNNKSYLSIILTEGKNHEVKKLFNYYGYKVIKLKRERLDFLTLDGLKKGEYRELKSKEVKELYNSANKNDILVIFFFFNSYSFNRTTIYYIKKISLFFRFNLRYFSCTNTFIIKFKMFFVHAYT